MKTAIIYLTIFILSGVMAFGQVGINDEGLVPDPSAMLDINSTTKGVLVPRMTIAERNGISNPAIGLLVFCTDNNAYFSNKGTPAVPNWVMISSQWMNNGNNIYYNSGNVGIGTTSAVLSLQVSGRIGASYGSVTSPSYTFENGFESTGFSSPSANSIAMITSGTEKIRLNQSGALGIGTSSPNSASLVEMSSTTRGFLPPRMTYLQRSALLNPPSGLMVFCSDCNQDGTGVVCIYEGGNWKTIPLTCMVPASPPAGSNVQTSGQIIWNWSTTPIANGYKWHTSNNFAAATQMGTVTTKTETGLTPGNSYTRYVWAYNACGNSEPTILTGQAMTCGSTFTVVHVAGSIAPVNKTVTYGTATNIPGEVLKCWITRNLGASQQAITMDDNSEAAAGWYWQFNRVQGYKHTGGSRTPNTAWITNITEDSDWTTPNDPCNLLLGSAWRVPTASEWTNVDNAGGWTNWNMTFNSTLKLHAAGYIRNDNNAFLIDGGINGSIWSSTQFDSFLIRVMYFGTGFSLVSNFSFGRGNGLSVRCLRE
jgi:hypothetical protein